MSGAGSAPLAEFARLLKAPEAQLDLAHACLMIGQDAYPGLEFDGAVTLVAPLAVPSQRNPKVRTFTAVIEVKGSHPNLLPDLTASIDLFEGTR